MEKRLNKNTQKPNMMTEPRTVTLFLSTESDKNALRQQKSATNLGRVASCYPLVTMEI